MTIKVGEKLPDATFTTMGSEGPQPMTTDDVFGGKRVVLFAVPGAYTPTCHQQHLPGFVSHIDEIKAKGVDVIACTGVNDVFVFDHWGKESGVGENIMMLADGSAEFAKATGLDIDLAGFGMGVRSKRYAMLVEDGVVKVLKIEDIPPEHDKSSAATLCSAIADKI